MATQRITVAKIGGIAADVVLQRLRVWAAARGEVDPDVWFGDPSSRSVRVQADAFADRLRANSLAPPVIYFVEWADLWSMGDLISGWLMPPVGTVPIAIYADRFEVYGYDLPDGGHLGRRLSTAGPQQFKEYDQFVGRLHEAVGAWQDFAERAVLIVLREVVGGLVTDEELIDSLSHVPEWLTEE